MIREVRVSSRAPLRATKKTLPRKSLVTKKKKRTKALNASKLKKELDRVFSLYIRSIHPKFCYTCNKSSTVLQNGHFVPRIYLATRWDESNCRPQCAGCNIWGRGQLLDFEENLIEEIGKEKVEFLKRKRNELWKLKPDWYIERIAYYKTLLESVENSKSEPKA